MKQQKYEVFRYFTTKKSTYSIQTLRQKTLKNTAFIPSPFLISHKVAPTPTHRPTQTSLGPL